MVKMNYLVIDADEYGTLYHLYLDVFFMDVDGEDVFRIMTKDEFDRRTGDE